MRLRISLVEAILTPMELIFLLITIVTLPFTAPLDRGLDVILFNSALPWGERYQDNQLGLPYHLRHFNGFNTFMIDIKMQLENKGGCKE